MDPDDFTDSMPGKLTPITTIEGASHAFVPDSLPPNWEWPEHLWPLLKEAHVALAGLNGVGKYLPNPDLLLHPLQQREAQKSSSLEGTYTDPDQQMVFQLDPSYPDSEEDPRNEFREVYNYKRALRLREESDLPISLRLIKRLHEVLLDGVRGAGRAPGRFRRSQNQIGRPVRYVPPPANRLDECLDKFEKYIHGDHPFDPLVEAFLLHYQFEAIHPFGDGNGRVGRLLLALMVAEWCDLSHQWLYMSAFFDRNRDEYINRLYSISTQASWEEWIEFCLHGVIEQAQDTERRCDRLLELNRELHHRAELIGGSHRLSLIIDNLFDHPAVRITQLRDRYGVSYNTAKSDVEKLTKVGILLELEDTSIRTFAAPEIVKTIYTD